MFWRSRFGRKIKVDARENEKDNGKIKKDFTQAIFSIEQCQNQTETTNNIIQKSFTEPKSKIEQAEIKSFIINNLY